jgi:oligoribonuclease NrnB/cAMP/cGMP phosphodiesterase (DHH superfamily)
MTTSAETLMPTLAIYYHNPCSDGNAAAWAIKEHLGQLSKYSLSGAYNIQFIPSAPGCQKIDQSLFVVGGSEAWFLDLMPSYDTLRDLCALCARVVVLDHHKTNLDICGRIHPEDLASGGWAANLELVFDMKRAGCQIAWDWITGQILRPDNLRADYLARPWFLEYIADRDLWTWRLPNSKLINSALFGLKLTITPDAIAEKLAPVRTDAEQQKFISEELMPYALAAEEFNNDLLRTAYHKATECQLVVPTTNDTYRVWLGTTIGSLRSDLGNQLCNKPLANGTLPDLAAIWHYEFPADEWWISLRSLDTGADVSAISKQFGGGGHMRAAGFTLHAPDNLNTIFKRIVSGKNDTSN